MMSDSDGPPTGNILWLLAVLKALACFIEGVLPVLLVLCPKLTETFMPQGGMTMNGD
jgi:hypothetical protein